MRATIAGVMMALGLGSISSAALAQSLAWRVTDVSGAVTIRHGAAERAAVTGAVLEPGDVIATAAGARAVMVHEKDFVTLAARSRATVPGPTEQASGFTKLLQDLGNAVYKIEKRGVPHFGVTTPYLAAVVKGTTFSITVDDHGSTLQVVEGAVEVATLDGGARDLILPAGVATVAAGDRLRLSVHGDSERVIDSPGRSAPATGPATGETTAPVLHAVASADAAAPMPDRGPMTADVIAIPVASRPVDLTAFTGGLVSGNAGFTALASAVTQAAKPAGGEVASVAASRTLVAVPIAAPASTPVVAATATVPVVAGPAVSSTAAVAAPSAVAAAAVIPVTVAVTPTPVVVAATPAPNATAVTATTAPVTSTVAAATTTPVVLPVVAPVPTPNAPAVAPVTPTPVLQPAVAATAPSAVLPAPAPLPTPAVPVAAATTPTPVVQPVTATVTASAGGILSAVASALPAGAGAAVATAGGIVAGVPAAASPAVTMPVQPVVVTTPVITSAPPSASTTLSIVAPAAATIGKLGEPLDDDDNSGKGRGNDGNRGGGIKGKR